MNPSGIDWIGDIPAEWGVKKLRYATALRSESGYFPAGDIYIGLENIESSTGKYIQTETEYIEGLYDIVRKGDVLFGKLRPYLEKVYISTIDGFCTGEFLNFKKFEGEKRYLYYFLLSHGFIETVNASTYGAKMPRAEWYFIKNLRIPIPPLAEQQAIADFLDAQCGRIDSIITEMEPQTEVLNQYKTSLITETVTRGLDKSALMKDSGIDWIGDIPAHWEMKRLKFLGTAKNGLTYDPEKISDEGILVLRSSNIQEGKLAFEDNVYVNMKVPKEIIIRENDILICSRNGSRELIGKCALIDKRIAGNTYGAFMCVFRSPYNQLLYYIFQSDLFNYYLGNYLTSTINQLTNANLYNMKVPITFDVKEQQAIAAFLDTQCGRIDRIITEKRQSIETMRTYKKSLIYEQVTGKKRVSAKW
jgi:type I restriction enzyme S subunit